MKIAFVADVHLGNPNPWGGAVECGLNERCREKLAVLKRANERRIELGCRRMVVLGDLFDTDHPLPQLIAEVQRLAGDDWVFMAGNHDQHSNMPGDHALAPLFERGIIVDQPRVLTSGLAMIPHMNGRAAEWLPAAVDSLKAQSGEVQALCVHVGVITDETPFFLKDAADAVTAEFLAEQARKLGAFAVFAGNWHDRRMRYVTQDGRVLKHKEIHESEPRNTLGFRARHETGDLVSVLQLGALVPTGFNNPGLEGYGTLAIFDPSADGYGWVKWQEFSGPRFVEAKSRAAAEKSIEECEKSGCRLYLNLKTPAAELARAKEYVESVKALGKVRQAEAIVDRDDAAGMVDVARGLRKTSSLEEVLVSYVERAAFDGEPDRAAVLECCRRMLVGVTQAGAVPITIRSIEASGIYEIDTYDVELPEKGLVIVTGSNGSGKTSVFNATPSLALWGKAARKTPPWRTGADAAVRVEVCAGGREVDARRWKSVGSDSPGLSFSPGGTEYKTTTKAQVELSRLIGSFDQWLNTSVFDAARDGNTRFGRLIDSSRKSFIEEIIGLDFDRPMELCRAERDTAKAKLAKAERTLAGFEAVLRECERTVAARQKEYVKAAMRKKSKGDADASKKDLEHAGAEVNRVHKELGVLAGERQRAESAIVIADRQIREARIENCPTCKQPLPKAAREEVVATHTAAANKARGDLTSVKAREEDARAELRRFQRDVEFHREEYANALAARDEVTRQEGFLDAADDALDAAEEKFAAAEVIAVDAAKKVAVLKAAEQTLGLRGVRAILVGQVLGVIEQSTNNWLSRLRFGGTVRLGIGDEGKIALEIDGVGGGYGYEALSLGQQGRIDLAFTRAFAGLHGDDGTLIFDEPFGYLDPEGTALALNLVEELAATRCVVLITNRVDFVEALKKKAVKHVNMTSEEVS